MGYVDVRSRQMCAAVASLHGMRICAESRNGGESCQPCDMHRCIFLLKWEAKEPLNPQNHRVGWCRPIHNSPLSKRWWLEEVMLSCIMQKSGIIACSFHFPMAKGSSSHIPNLSNHRWTNLMEYERPEMFYELRIEQWTNLGCLVYIGDSWAGIIFDYIYIYIYICVFILPSYVGITMGTIIRIPVNQPGFEGK